MTVNCLNNSKICLLNGKIYNLLAAENLEQIKIWESMQGASYWNSVTFDKLKNTKKQILLVLVLQQKI